MEKLNCPRCKHALDEGHVNVPGNAGMGYVSEKQTGMLRVQTKISRAHVCPNCGYVEIYLDPEELKKKLK